MANDYELAVIGGCLQDYPAYHALSDAAHTSPAELRSFRKFDQNRSFVGFNYGPHDKDLITYTVYAMGRQSKNLINADKVIKFGLPASFETIQNRNVKFRSDMPGIFTPRSPKRWTEPPGERFSSGPSRSFPDRWPVVRFRGP